MTDLSGKVRLGFAVFVLSAAFAGCSSKRAPRDPNYAGVAVEALDGDTLLVKTDAGANVVVRLTDIDAPELDQAFGAKARSFLDAYTRTQRVVMRPRGARGDLLEARVLRDDQDLSAYMVEHGFAWVLPGVEDAELLELQEIARRWKVNLWVQHNLRPAWEHRAGRAHEEWVRDTWRTEQSRFETGSGVRAAEVPACRGAAAKVARAREIFSNCLKLERGKKDCSKEEAGYWAVEKQYQFCFEL